MQELACSLQDLDMSGQSSLQSMEMPFVIPNIVDSLVEYHANIGCYQCYLFLDSHKDGYKQMGIVDIQRLCVQIDFPYVKLMYKDSKNEESLKRVWCTEIERNVDANECTVEDKEDHWYLRLPIRANDKQPLGGFSSFTQVSAVELRPESYASVCCKGCNAQLLGGEGNAKIEKVLPLPSANWVDMFDFWGAGMGAFEHLSREEIYAQLHRVLVGESYVLLHASDLVENAVASDCEDEADVALDNDVKEKLEWMPLVCVACSGYLGLSNVDQPDTLRLHKHRICAHQLVQGDVEDSHAEKGQDKRGENIFGNYTIDSILSAKLLETADSDGIFRFVLISSNDKHDHNQLCGRQDRAAPFTELQLQLLSWETMIKQLDTNKFCRVLKVLYSPCQVIPAIPDLVPSHNVSLPLAMCLMLAKRLQASSTLLPSSLRVFNRMNVGYLFA